MDYKNDKNFLFENKLNKTNEETNKLNVKSSSYFDDSFLLNDKTYKFENKLNNSYEDKNKVNIKSSSYVIDVLRLKEKDYFSSAINNIQNLYNTSISKLKRDLINYKEKLKKFELSEEDKIQKIVDRDSYDFNEDEKKQLYDFYIKKNKNSKINSISYVSLDDETFYYIYQELSMYFALKDMNDMLEKGENTFANLQSLVSSYENQICKLENARDNIVLFSLDKNYITKENVELLKDLCTKLLKQNKIVKIGIDSLMEIQDNRDKANYLYSAEELDLIVGLEKLLKSYGKDNIIKFNELNKFESLDDFEKGWTLKQVIQANAIIDKIVYDLKENGLSPFEIVLDLHKELSKIKYNRSSNIEESRVIVGVLNNKKVVCSGYSSLLKAIIDKLDDKNLKCDIIGCRFYSKDNQRIGEHTHNLIYINDEEYNIQGYYACDITADANSSAKPYDFSHCMFPVNDLLYYKNMRYSQKFYKNRRDSLIVDIKDFKGYLKSNVLYKLATKINSFKMSFNRPDIVEKYGEKSIVIPLEKFKKGIINLAIKDKDFVGKSFDKDFIDNIISQTEKHAKESFENGASNSFVSADNNHLDSYLTNLQGDDIDR